MKGPSAILLNYTVYKLTLFKLKYIYNYPFTTFIRTLIVGLKRNARNPAKKKTDRIEL